MFALGRSSREELARICEFKGQSSGKWRNVKAMNARTPKWLLYPCPRLGRKFIRKDED